MRKDLNMSQAEVAYILGTTQTFYSKLEKGQRYPSHTSAKKYAKILGCPWTKFFEDEENTSPEGGESKEG